MPRQEQIQSTSEIKEDKMESIKLTQDEIKILEEKISAKVNALKEKDLPELIREIENTTGKSFEEAIKEVYDQNNWNEEKTRSSFKGKLGRIFGGDFSGSVLSNLLWKFKLNGGYNDEKSPLGNFYSRTCLNRAIENEPKIKTFVDMVLYATKKQDEIKNKDPEGNRGGVKQSTEGKEIEDFLSSKN